MPAFRRFVLTYQSEELRQKWIASDIHQSVRGMIENTMRNKDYAVLLYDVVSGVDEMKAILFLCRDLHRTRTGAVERLAPIFSSSTAA